MSTVKCVGGLQNLCNRSYLLQIQTETGHSYTIRINQRGHVSPCLRISTLHYIVGRKLVDVKSVVMLPVAAATWLYQNTISLHYMQSSLAFRCIIAESRIEDLALRTITSCRLRDSGCCYDDNSSHVSLLESSVSSAGSGVMIQMDINGINVPSGTII